jgi:hypothetical protein
MGDNDPIVRAVRITTPLDQLAWVQFSYDRIPGRWFGYGATTFYIAWINPDGTWVWHSGGEDDCGEAVTVEAAKTLLDARWAASLTPPVEMTADEKAQAYRKLLIHCIQMCDSQDSGDAEDLVAQLDRAGWLSDCPELDPNWLNYFPGALVLRLEEAGKLPKDFDDLL